MRFIASLFVIGITLIPLIYSTSPALGQGFHLPTLENLERDVESLWAKFKKGFDVAFHSAEEDLHRFKIFADHLKLIIKHNLEHDLGLQTFRLAVNKYAALTNQEFRQKFNGYQHKRNASLLHSSVRQQQAKIPTTMTLPLTVDWRNQGLVTPVKDQGQCGSCWSFSATGALEAQHARATGKLVSLSEQQLIDCSPNWGNNGCNGGLMDNAFKYVHDNKGLDTEGSYPYLEQEQNTCKFSRRSIATTCDGYVDIPEGDETALQQALAIHGPVSVAIDASQPSFQFYKAGVYSDPSCSSQNLDHGVLAVGYGVTDDDINGQQEYFLVKNSWSAGWGDEGYIKIARNQNNMCGIATAASYPIVSNKQIHGKQTNPHKQPQSN